MKIKRSLVAFGLMMALTSISQANDINLSWNVNILKAQALTQVVKKAQLKKYSQKNSRNQVFMSSTKDIGKIANSKYP